jgi:hypothetical protein
VGGECGAVNHVTGAGGSVAPRTPTTGDTTSPKAYAGFPPAVNVASAPAAAAFPARSPRVLGPRAASKALVTGG